MLLHLPFLFLNLISSTHDAEEYKCRILEQLLFINLLRGLCDDSFSPVVVL